MFEKIYRVDAYGRQEKIPIQDLQIMANQDAVSDLNLIYRSNTKTAFAAFRLNSFISNKSGRDERVTMFLVEIGTYDSRKPKGQRQTGYVQIYLDEDDFSYFCSLMMNGRIVDRFARGEKVPYKHHSGTSDAKRLRAYRGQKMPIILEAAQGPGKKGDNGQTLPDDWEGRNKEKVKKTLIGLNEEEAHKIGAAGLRAISILDMWRAFGRDEENLALINVTKKREKDSAAGTQRDGFGYARRGAENGEYQRGFSQNGGYAAAQNQPVAPFIDRPQTFGQGWA